MSWTIERLYKANFLQDLSDKRVCMVENFLNTCKNEQSPEEKLDKLVQNFNNNPDILNPPEKYNNFIEIKSVCESVIKNIYKTPCALQNVTVKNCDTDLILRPLKAIINLEFWKPELSIGQDELVELLSEYIGYELRLFIGHDFLLERKVLNIIDPLIATHNTEANIINFHFTYTSN